LIDAVVLLDAGEPLFPEPAEARLLPCRGHLRAEHLEVELQPPGELINEAVGLGEKIPRVDQYNGDSGAHSRHEVQRNGRLSSEAGSQYMRAGQHLEGERGTLIRREGLKSVIKIVEHQLVVRRPAA